MCNRESLRLNIRSASLVRSLGFACITSKPANIEHILYEKYGYGLLIDRDRCIGVIGMFMVSLFRKFRNASPINAFSAKYRKYV
jgi:hypothetical protein